MNVRRGKNRMSFKSKEFPLIDILGKKIEILSCSNRYNINKVGKIVNETKNMIYLLSEEKNAEIKRISKKEIDLYKVILPSGDYFINGKTLLGRPEEKISKIK
jgi:RNase P/RNase MRP subunit p29